MCRVFIDKKTVTVTVLWHLVDAISILMWYICSLSSLLICNLPINSPFSHHHTLFDQFFKSSFCIVVLICLFSESVCRAWPWAESFSLFITSDHSLVTTSPGNNLFWPKQCQLHCHDKYSTRLYCTDHCAAESGQFT